MKFYFAPAAEKKVEMPKQPPENGFRGKVYLGFSGKDLKRGAEAEGLGGFLGSVRKKVFS